MGKMLIINYSLIVCPVPLPIIKTEKWVVFGGLACGHWLAGDGLYEMR